MITLVPIVDCTCPTAPRNAGDKIEHIKNKIEHIKKGIPQRTILPAVPDRCRIGTRADEEVTKGRACLVIRNKCWIIRDSPGYRGDFPIPSILD